MGGSRTEVNGRSTADDARSALHDQTAALVDEVRELRGGYEYLVARIDEALADRYEEDQIEADAGEEISGRELCLVNLAMEGYTREEATARLVELFGQGDPEDEAGDEEVLARIFGSGPFEPSRPRGRFFRRP